MKHFFLIISSFIYSYSFSQKVVIEDSIFVSGMLVDRIETDFNNSLYLISKTKIEKRFQKKKSRTIDLRSVITSVDTTNPLRTYVFSNFNQLNILDDDLNLIQDPIFIGSKDYVPISLGVVDNQFCWFYDLITNKIIFFNYQLQKVVLSSGQIYFKNNDKTIERIYTYQNNVYLKGDKTIYIYDNYGNFKSNFNLNTENQSYFFYKNSIFFVNNNFLTEFNLKTHSSRKIIETSNPKSFTLNNKNLYILYQQKIIVYSIINKEIEAHLN